MTLLWAPRDGKETAKDPAKEQETGKDSDTPPRSRSRSMPFGSVVLRDEKIDLVAVAKRAQHDGRR